MTSGGKEEGSRKEEANAGFNPAEKKKGEWMATGIMDDEDAGYNPAE